MPVKSYLLISKKGQITNLEAELEAFPYCEVAPAQNKEVLILLTDTPNEAAETKLFEQLQQLPTLQHLNLVAAFA